MPPPKGPYEKVLWAGARIDLGGGRGGENIGMEEHSAKKDGCSRGCKKNLSILIVFKSNALMNKEVPGRDDNRMD